MRILVLGGTRFVGRALAQAALDAGHEVTLFNRGRTDPGAFPDLEHVRGDRGEGLDALRGRTWDAVFDPSCYVPRLARISARALAEVTEHYVFVSSLSVYEDQNLRGVDESAPVATTDDPGTEIVDGDTYGALKALCEREVLEVLGDRALIVRAGYIVGPHDTVDRLPYWIRRIARGGQILAPVGAGYPAQLIDARDIAAWTLAMTDRRVGGTFNVTGPPGGTTLGEVLATCARVTGSDHELVWVPEAFLLAQGLDPDEEPLPYWVGPAYEGGLVADVTKAFAAGLEMRPLEVSVRDTDAWDAARGRPEPLRVGISPEREREVLDAWRAARRAD